MENNKKTILITGGAGFIGSHLVEKYLGEGHKVIGVDNLQTTYTDDNIVSFKSNPDFTFIKHDIIEPLEINEKLDWILNFACPAQCINLQYDPVHTIKTSVHGVINMLELARKNQARIMQASTSEIYGDKPRIPERETDPGEVSTLGPRACYDEGKRLSETLMMDYHRQYGIDVRIIRIFNTYGPRMYVRDGRVMSNFILRALKGEPITIYGDGSYTRSFQYVSDLVAGIDKMMKQDDFLGPVNLGNPHEITIKELAETVIAETDSSSNLEYADSVTDDPVRRQPAIDLAKEKLNWEPTVSLKEGIQKTVKYFKHVDLPDQKILVFTTTYEPDIGPAEKALKDLTWLMPETQFHIITVKSRRNLKDIEKFGNATVYRLGSGNMLGKYLFPFRGALKAKELAKKHKYRFVWSVMASYGAIAAAFLRMTDRRLNFLVTFDRSETEGRGVVKSRLINPVIRFIFRQADSVYLSDPDLEKEAQLSEKGLDLKVMAADGRGLVTQVKHTYNQLLNKQEKKLDRPL